ncbi:PREDICTED: uncharacterized protein LOC105452746 [Wasmannia auropunctata]|uniref:uncharacterized protein LOC105452746 n=1 Tax=Wasmannia auropunctata TaxID=64793 RepID=UPI0005ED6A97|nr:PREDICTED: uncharacterized protein LOC105452746 [Wasmannia auropunctata]
MEEPTRKENTCFISYDILRIIFQYLDARNLASAAMVCRSWLEAANDEKLTRGPYCLQLYTQHDFLCCIKNIRIKPSVGFFFIPTGIRYEIEEHVETFLPELLPKRCEIIMLCSRYVILEEVMCQQYPHMVCAFLPQVPNVKVKSFELSENCNRNIWQTVEYQEIINTIINNEISTSNHETSTCFMLFCNNFSYNLYSYCDTAIGIVTAKRWASAIQQSIKNKAVSVWGGVVENIHAQRARTGSCKAHRVEPFEKSHTSCVAVLITGLIRTWSTILERKCNTKKRIEARLMLFKDKVKLKKHSIGFIFTNKMRTGPIYNDAPYNEESMIFKRLFPKVPLVGCSDYIGEFGKTTAIDEASEERNSKKKQNCKKSKSWYKESSTVFLILTYD